MGSGFGSVGRAVASDSRDPRFNFSHWQKNYNERFLVFKDQNKEKRAGNGNETVIFFSNLGNCADLVWIFSKGACFKCLIYKNKGQTLCYP